MSPARCVRPLALSCLLALSPAIAPAAEPPAEEAAAEEAAAEAAEQEPDDAPRAGAAPTGGELNDWEISPYLGFGMPDDYPYPGLGSLSPDTDVLFGIRMGYFFTPVWSAELSWQLFSGTTDIAGPDPDLDIQSVRWNVLYNWREGERWRQ